MNRVAIMQPTYLPWLGYMGMLDMADTFVLLDTVDVSPKSWQMRNRIRARDGNVVWLSVPTNAKRGMPLNEVQIVENGWRQKHWRTLEAAYSHLPGWPELEHVLTPIRKGVRHSKDLDPRLSTLTGAIIHRIAGVLGDDLRINWEHNHRRIVTASQIGKPFEGYFPPFGYEPPEPFHPREDRLGRIADILHHTQATSFLATPGSTFLEGMETLEGIPIEWFNYTHPTYQQGNQEWMSHLSVIDLIAHSGSDSLNVIRAGYPPMCETRAESATN